MEDIVIRDFFLGFIKLHILYHSKEEEIYGQEFQNELARHGYNISFGTLYPIFHKLEKNGYLSSRKVNVNGKIRKYYSITSKGSRVLEKSKLKAKELFEELFEK
ncbi:MAG: helix-turn-helix transcriptional regulator [Actinobacteria bacterium]|nr:helix-turn-helix transcriptional regulator [Actinomycetota bacterium]